MKGQLYKMPGGQDVRVLNARGNLDTLLTLASAWVNESPEEADVQVCDRILVLRRNNVNRGIRTSDLG